MAQPPMTYRPLNADPSEDAPPPYEASAPATSLPSPPHNVAPATAAATPPHSYPVLNPSYLHGSSDHTQQNDGTTSLPPPSMDYYPAMTTSPYPALIGAGAPRNPQSYPAMPVQSAGSGSYPVSHSPGRLLPQHQPSAPWVLLDEPSIGQSTPQVSHAVSESPELAAETLLEEKTAAAQTSIHQEHDSIDSGTSSSNLIDLSNWSAGPDPTSLPPTELHSPSPIPPSSSLPSVPTIAAVELVTSYRCRRCGAVLESETAPCKRIHTLTAKMAEWQIRHATELDLDQRRRSRDVGSSFSAAEGSHLGYNQGAFEGGNGYEQNIGSRSHSFETQGREAGHGSYHGSSNDIYFRDGQHQDGGYRSEEFNVPHSAAASSSSSSLSTSSTPTHENNYGTNDTYMRRSISVQNPMIALKKLWRDAKKEIGYQASGSHRNSQREIVAPPPLLFSMADDATGGTYLGRSNTYAGDHTVPAYNPMHVQPGGLPEYNPDARPVPRH